MRILRTNQVVALTGLSRSTLWRYQRDLIFPKRIALGPGAVGWPEEDIAAWIQERREAKPAPQESVSATAWLASCG